MFFPPPVNAGYEASHYIAPFHPYRDLGGSTRGEVGTRRRGGEVASPRSATSEQTASKGCQPVHKGTAVTAISGANSELTSTFVTAYNTVPTESAAVGSTARKAPRHQFQGSGLGRRSPRVPYRVFFFFIALITLNSHIALANLKSE